METQKTESEEKLLGPIDENVEGQGESVKKKKQY